MIFTYFSVRVLAFMAPLAARRDPGSNRGFTGWAGLGWAVPPS
jgi:hypothetical protein